MVESLPEILKKKKPGVSKLTDVHSVTNVLGESVTNVLGESISSISMWNIVNQ